jgi:hypothetical protein
LTIVKYCML